MAGIRKSDENNRSDRDPLTNHADYKEIDYAFRKRLDAMVPEDIAKRIQEIMDRRIEDHDQKENKRSTAV